MLTYESSNAGLAVDGCSFSLQDFEFFQEVDCIFRQVFLDDGHQRQRREDVNQQQVQTKQHFVGGGVGGDGSCSLQVGQWFKYTSVNVGCYDIGFRTKGSKAGTLMDLLNK